MTAGGPPKGADRIEGLWYSDWPAAVATRFALSPLSLLFGAGVSLRNALYENGGLAVRRAPAPVVSVGSLRVGGAGKTPFALWLANRLAERGRRPCLVTRGYGGRAASPFLIRAGEASHAGVVKNAGDEAALLALRTLLPVAVGADRYEACMLAMRTLDAPGQRPDVFVLDDGFQHRGLARDLDIVLVSGRESAEALLPAGPLRERARAAARADAVVAIGAADDEWKRDAAASFQTRAHLLATALVANVSDREGEALSMLEGRGVVAVAAIARPERFLAILERAGARVVASVLRRDHHRYGTGDLRAIEAAAAGGDLVVTTEKDLVKLAGRLPGLPEGALRALRVDLEVEDEEALLALVPGGASFDR